MVGFELLAISGDALPQGLDLACDRVVAGLLVRRHARVQGHLPLRHAHLRACGPDRSPVAGWPSRPSGRPDRKSTRLNSSHANISYAVFCLKKKKSSFTPITFWRSA